MQVVRRDPEGQVFCAGCQDLVGGLVQDFLAGRPRDGVRQLASGFQAGTGYLRYGAVAYRIMPEYLLTMAPRRAPDDAPSRRPGRPRDAAIDAAILQAASEQFVERGLQGLSMERVAAVAGVGKATIYRRWGSKEEMVADALASMPGADALPDTGSLATDVRAGLREVVDELRSPAGRARPRILAEVSSGSALGTVFMRRVVEPRRARWVALIRRAIDRGELDASVDPELASDLVLGAPIWAAITRRIDAFDDRAIDALAALVCDGLLAAQSSRGA